MFVVQFIHNDKVKNENYCNENIYIMQLYRQKSTFDQIFVECRLDNVHVEKLIN